MKKYFYSRCSSKIFYEEKNAHLNTLITEGADQSQINQLIDELGDLQTEIRKERISTQLKIRVLLTDEQKIKFSTHFRNRIGHDFSFNRSFGRQGRGRK